MDSNRPNVKPEKDTVGYSNSPQLVDTKSPADIIEAQKNEINKVLLSGFKSPYTLVLAIAMSVITVCCFVQAFTSANGFAFAINAAIGSVALFDCFGIWKILVYDKQLTPEGLKSFQRFASLQKALNIVLMILFGLLSGILIVISILLMVAFDQLSSDISEIIYVVGALFDYEILIGAETISSFLLIGPTIIFILALIVVIVITLYYTLVNRALKKIVKHVDRISACVSGSGEYDIDKRPPYISLIIFGGLNIFALFISSNVGVWSAIYSIALSVYFIFIALLFRSIHNKVKKYNPACVGTAVHKFIEVCDLEKLHQNGIEAELDRLVAEKGFSSDETDYVKLRSDEIETFRRSDIFREMRQAKKLHREYHIKPTSKGGEGSIIDCIIINRNDDIKIADFKTDRQPEEQFIEEYSSQLSKYKDAVEHKFGKSPASMEVYSFYLGKSIPIQINE